MLKPVASANHVSIHAFFYKNIFIRNHTLTCRRLFLWRELIIVDETGKVEEKEANRRRAKWRVREVTNVSMGMCIKMD